MATTTKTKPRKADEFRREHDKSLIVPGKIRDGIKKLGTDGWLYEGEFLASLGISPVDFSRFKAEFEAFVVTPPGSNKARTKRVWCGSTKLAVKLRAVIE